jgi:hypothetical protein
MPNFELWYSCRKWVIWHICVKVQLHPPLTVALLAMVSLTPRWLHPKTDTRGTRWIRRPTRGYKV